MYGAGTIAIVAAGMAFMPPDWRRGSHARGLACWPIPETRGPATIRRPGRDQGPVRRDFVYFPLAIHALQPRYENDAGHMSRTPTWSVNASTTVVIEDKSNFASLFLEDRTRTPVGGQAQAAGIPQWPRVGTSRGSLGGFSYGAEVHLAGRGRGSPARLTRTATLQHTTSRIAGRWSARPYRDVLLLAPGDRRRPPPCDNPARRRGCGWVGTRLRRCARSPSRTRSTGAGLSRCRTVELDTPTRCSGAVVPHSPTPLESSTGLLKE